MFYLVYLQRKWKSVGDQSVVSDQHSEEVWSLKQTKCLSVHDIDNFFCLAVFIKAALVLFAMILYFNKGFFIHRANKG